MANNITLKSTDAYGGRYLQLECTQYSNGSAANTSTIKWKLSSIGGSSNLYATGPTTVVINGTTVYSKSRVAWYGTGTESNPVAVFPACKGSVEGELTVYHDDNGSKTIDVSLSTAVGVYNVSEYSDNWVLDTIPRYANFTSLYLSNITETSVAVNWDANATVDYIAYYLNGGGAIFVNPDKPFYIYGLSANTTNTLQVAIRRADSLLWTYSGTMEFTTYDYPKPVSMNHFIIGEGAKIEVYNPLNRTYTLNLLSREDWGYIGTYTGTHAGVVNAEFNEEWAIQRQYATIPNKTTGRYIAVVTYDGVERTLDWGGTYSIDSSKCLPTFTDFSYADTSYVADNTGNNQVLVKNLSTLSVIIGENQKMKARNGANPDRYVISVDTKSESVGYAESAVSKDLGSISNKGTLRLTVRAIDSRGLSTSVYKDITVYDYEKPAINVDVKRLNNFGERTALKVNGTFYPVTLANGLNANTIRNVYYRYRELNGVWSALSEFNKTVTGNEYTCNDVELQLDNTKAFEIEVLTYDAMSYDTVTATVNVGQGVFFVSSNQKACFVNGQKIIMYDVVDTWGGW